MSRVLQLRNFFTFVSILFSNPNIVRHQLIIYIFGTWGTIVISNKGDEKPNGYES